MRPRVVLFYPPGSVPIVCKRFLRTQPVYHAKESDPVNTGSGSGSGNNENNTGNGQPSWLPSLASPRQLVEYLNDYVVGQTRAKKILAVAVYNHYNRVRANLNASLPDGESMPPWESPGPRPDPLLPHPARRRALASPNYNPNHPHYNPALSMSLPRPVPLFDKSNVLVLGPTGTGKTLLARTLARVLDVPFSVSDATSFTQAGYVGDDVEMCVQRLLQASNWDPYRAGTGIIYIDEADKLARRTAGGDGMQRDVGGEGVQQALLRMMEGSIVTVTAKPNGEQQPGMGEGRRGRGGNMPGQPESYQVDTSNVLFILSGAFVGLDKIVKRRITKGSIGFGASLTSKSDSDNNDDFVPFFTKNGQKADPWSLTEPTDLVSYGYIPEFVSRLPIVTSLSPLSTTDLLHILTEIKGSLISQYSALFRYSNVDIHFTTPALYAIASLAHSRGGGARGLRGIMESVLLEAMYDVPGSSVRYVLITKAVVDGKEKAGYWSRGEGAAFWSEWAKEEDMSKKDIDQVLDEKY